jgi:hypothetical protein
VATRNIFDILRTPDDYLDWDRHIEYCEVIDGLTTEQRVAAQIALKHLRRVFSRPNFLRDIASTAHPLAYWVVRNTAPWTRLWLVRVSEALQALKTAEGFPRLLGKLCATSQKHVVDSIEAFSVLEIAYKFLKAGFEVSSIEPAVVVANPSGKNANPSCDPKHPDLKLVDPRSGEEIFVEVTALSPSQILRESQVTSDWLWRISLSYLWSDDLVRCVQVERMLTEAERYDLTEQVKQLVVRATSTNSLQTIDREEIKVGVAPVSCEANLVTWANERGLEFGIAGLPIVLDGELDRLINYKLHRKMKKGQLPPQRPGILVITDQSMLTPVFSSHEIISKLTEESREYPNLWCVVITRPYLGQAETGTRVDLQGGHLIIDRAVADPLREQTIIVLNDGYKLSSKSSDRIRDAFS